MTDEILDRIIGRVHGRQERWKTRTEVLLPPPQWLDETCIVGGYSICGLSTRRRFIREDCIINVDHTGDTPSSLARDYLTIVYKKAPPIRYVQRQAIATVLGRYHDDVSSKPYLVAPCEFDNGYYVDIRACYWSVMLLAGWDLQYYPGRYLGLRRPPLDFPFADHKVARNCLVSLGMIENSIIWKKDVGFVKVKSGNPLRNSQLQCLIHDILHSVAAVMEQLGAVYINTDGYIFTASNAAEAAMNVLAEWGLEGRVKHRGRGYVAGIGIYKVGGHKSKIDPYAPHALRQITEIEYASWLRERLSWARSLRGFPDAKSNSIFREQGEASAGVPTPSTAS